MKTDEVKLLSPAERFLYWITERESIRQKRRAGSPPPWTENEILSTYRFCNVRRMDDAVSQWLLKNWYTPWRDHPRMPLAASLARFINFPDSLAEITAAVFGKRYEPEKAKRILRHRASFDRQVFNGAYMVRGNDGQDKIASVFDHYAKPLHDDPPEVDTSSFRRTWEALVPRYGFGSFMAGQVTADLRHALSGTWEDVKTFAPAGPGSMRGMNRLLERPLKNPFPQESFSGYLVEVIEQFSPFLPPILVRRMEAIDWQNCLCEFDKHERCLWGEGRPKALYRVKE